MADLMANSYYFNPTRGVRAQLSIVNLIVFELNLENESREKPDIDLSTGTQGRSCLLASLEYLKVFNFIKYLSP